MPFLRDPVDYGTAQSALRAAAAEAGGDFIDGGASVKAGDWLVRLEVTSGGPVLAHADPEELRWRATADFVGTRACSLVLLRRRGNPLIRWWTQFGLAFRARRSKHDLLAGGSDHTVVDGLIGHRSLAEQIWLRLSAWSLLEIGPLQQGGGVLAHRLTITEPTSTGLAPRLRGLSGTCEMVLDRLAELGVAKTPIGGEGRVPLDARRTES